MTLTTAATAAWPSTRPTAALGQAWRRQHRAALPVAGVLAAIPLAYLLLGMSSLAVLWLFGLAFGIVLQRSRFCFASGFRDLYLFGEGRMLKGIIIGMAVATVGFGLLMGKLVPDPSTGAFPARAGVYPLGYQTFVGGLMFGLGMVVAGGLLDGPAGLAAVPPRVGRRVRAQSWTCGVRSARTPC